MRMQEPEEWQKHSDFDTEYAERDELEHHEELHEPRAEEGYQGQKIYPQENLSSRGRTRSILAMILSSIVFILAMVGLELSSTVLNYANGREDRLLEGTIGQISSIVIMLVCVAIFIVLIARRINGMRRQSERTYWGTHHS